jgi:hypothetical protein
MAKYTSCISPFDSSKEKDLMGLIFFCKRSWAAQKRFLMSEPNSVLVGEIKSGIN